MKFKLIVLIFLSLPFQVNAAVKIKIGWQVPWAVQGQIVQIWKHTKILESQGLQAEFIGKTYGPELNELALAKQVDLILTADQPAATLFSKNKDDGKGWVGIGRLMYNRTSTYVPLNSKIKSLVDLKGKTVGLPMGAAAERITLNALYELGLKNQDFKIINLDIKEHGALIKKFKNAEKWDQFDALAGFDPVPSILEAQKMIRVIHVGKVVSMMLANEEFLKLNSGVEKKLQSALVDAYDYYAKNTQQADKWFMEEAHLAEINEAALSISASLEPNLQAKKKSDIRISFNKDDLRLLQEAAKFIEPKVGKLVDIKKYTRNVSEL